MPTLKLLSRATGLSWLACAVSLMGCSSDTGLGETPPIPTSAEIGLSSCSIAPGAEHFEEVEVSCDGLDNDCDGLTDILLPVKQNVCTTAAKGMCSKGYSACAGSTAVCMAPAATAEVRDGLDNDCDGATDEDAGGIAMRPRLRVMVPPYLWEEEPEIVKGARQALDQLGVPYDADASAADWAAAFDTLNEYTVVLIPGYVGAWAFGEVQLDRLSAWVAQGGTLVMTRVVRGGDSEDLPLLALSGVASATQHTAVESIEIQPAAASFHLDSTEERRVPVQGGPDSYVDVYTYAPVGSSGAQGFGRAIGPGGADLGAALIRRPLGAGLVYTLGEDFAGFLAPRCYINCFDPGRDIYGLLLRDMLAESAHGHAVFKHTVPGTADSVLLVSHDVDAPDSHNDGLIWGRAGAIQMAQMEVEEDVESTWFIQTNYVEGYYNPETIKTLWTMGMRAFGGHSNLHAAWETMPLGSCAVTRDGYDPKSPTVCGEVDVNLELLRAALPEARLDLWRSPLLSISNLQFPVLNSQGVVYDSSFATGDLRTSYPVTTDRMPYMDDVFHGMRMYTFPIHAEDGMGWIDPDGTERRVELQDATYRRFLTSWTYTMLQNKRNGAWTMLLVHPSWGQGVGPENLPIKIAAVREMIQRAKAHDIPIRTLDEAGDFWRGRDGVGIDASYDPADGYRVVLTVGEYPAPEFSLQFGDAIGAITCEGETEACPEATIAGARVVFDAPLPAGSSYTFRATTKTPAPQEAP